MNKNQISNITPQEVVQAAKSAMYANPYEREKYIRLARLYAAQTGLTEAVQQWLMEGKKEFTPEQYIAWAESFPIPFYI